MDSLLMSTPITIDAERFPASNAVNDSFFKAAEEFRLLQLKTANNELRDLCEDVLTRSRCPLLEAKARTLLAGIDLRERKRAAATQGER